MIHYLWHTNGRQGLLLDDNSNGGMGDGVVELRELSLDVEVDQDIEMNVSIDGGQGIEMNVNCSKTLDCQGTP